MTLKDEFYKQLAETIQAWLLVELEVFFLYSEIMSGANVHLISVTFHHIESFESKLGLIDSCLALYFERDSESWKIWRGLMNSARKSNSKRNRIVHQPVKTGYSDGKEIIEISPSYFNSLTLSKRQTSYNGKVITHEYKPQSVRLLDEHRIDFYELIKMKSEFQELSKKLANYRSGIKDILQGARESLNIHKDFQN